MKSGPAPNQRNVDYEELRVRETVTRQFKASHLKENADCCTVCSWRPPVIPASKSKSVRTRRSSMLHMHHVIAQAKGGDHSSYNLVLLCPNHHAIAHAIASIWVSTQDGRTCVTRAKLITALRLADARPADWLLRFDEKEGKQVPLPKAIQKVSKPRRRIIGRDGKPRRYAVSRSGKAILVPLHPLAGVGF